MTVVAVDAMGGDRAPAAAVEGALAAARTGIEVALVGDVVVIERELARIGSTPPGVRLVHAPDAIEMGEHAALEARTRRGSSIYIGVQLVQRHEADAFVSAGNTGAVFAIALLTLGRLPGIERPALGAVLPLPAGPTLLLDVGANAEVRASHLVQFAHIGVAYMRAVGGVAAPTVGLLNIGEEPTKGSPVSIEAHAALATSGLRFVGNIEGRDVFAHRADVVVADGFTGNAILKAAEGVIDVLFTELRRVAADSLRARVGALLMRPALRAIADRTDYRRYGAVPLLGVDGAVFVAHGRSDPRAIASAIITAARATERGMRDALAASVGAAQKDVDDEGVTRLESRGP
jgi:glycerol-3-phosphate acyltransferase PlsX